ncbi:hypothetical protein [Fodinicurvata sp. EGI_FJ10296]|uniref:hypothetical protein n=1 Tax=Fodinicurvata sp. EGI_FJ10296 TaxID=3231908 RepID=UPI003451467D
MKIGKFSYSAFVLALLANVAEAQQPVEGVHYEELSEPFGASEDSVVNIFSPACPHCYRLEDGLKAWADENDLYIVRVPFFHEDQWAELGRLIITMQETNNDQEDNITALFTAIHENDVEADDVDALIDSLPISDEQTVLIEETYSSGAVSDREDEIRAWLLENRIRAIPAVVVNDKFFSDPARARGNDNLLLLLDHLTTIQ